MDLARLHSVATPLVHQATAVEMFDEQQSFVLDGEVVALSGVNPLPQPVQAKNLVIRKPSRAHDLDFDISPLHEGSEFFLVFCGARAMSLISAGASCSGGLGGAK